MNDDSSASSEEPHHGMRLPFFFPGAGFFPFQMMMRGGGGDDDDSSDDDSDDEEGGGYGAHRVVVTKLVTCGDYRFYLKLLECKYFDSHGFLVVLELKQKLNEGVRFTGVEAVDRIVHSFVPESPVIGRLKAPVLLRPYDDFIDVTDFYECEQQVRTFCNTYGIAKQCLHPQLRQCGEAVQKGSVVVFENCEIHPEHCGKDLSLHMMHQVLDFLDYAATITTAPPPAQPPAPAMNNNNGPVNQAAQVAAGAAAGAAQAQQQPPAGNGATPRFHPNENYRWGLAIVRPSCKPITECEFWNRRTIREKGWTSAKRNTWALQSLEKVTRHLARFGFQQAGPNSEQQRDWFVTREMRQALLDTVNHNSNNGTPTKASKKRKRSAQPTQQQKQAPTSVVKQHWLDKSATSSLEFFKGPDSPDKGHRGNRQALLKGLEEFFVSKHKAEMALLDGMRKFDRWMEEAKLKQQLNEVQQYPTVLQVHKSTQQALEQSRKEVRDAVLKELQALRERFLEQELPALLKKGKKGTGAKLINDTRAVHRVLEYAAVYPDIQHHTSSVDPRSAENSLLTEVYQMEDFVSCLKLFYDFGADMNLREPLLGNTPLHVTMAVSNKHGFQTIFQYLLSIGANPSLQNGKHETPADVLVSHFAGLFSQYRYARSETMTEKLIARLVEYCTALMPRADRAQLLDGWLSPRNAQMLETTADLVHQKGVQMLSALRGNRHISHRDMLDNGFFEYVPSQVREQNNRHGFHKKFVQGWFLIFEAANYLLKEQGKPPTVDNVQHLLTSQLLPNGSCKSLSGQRSALKLYLDGGGEIDFGIDALIAATRKEYDNGGRKSGNWGHTVPSEESRQHVITPLDGVFEVSRIMLVTRGGGSFERYGMGPFRRY